MPLDSSSAEAQSRLASYCRLKDIAPAFIHRERSQLYRELVFGNVKQALDRAYPLSRLCLGQENWENLTKDFFNEHACASPILWQMPQELIGYVAYKQFAERLEKPFLLDLLRFEWLEIEVFMMPDAQHTVSEKVGDIWQDRLVLNLNQRLAFFEYPVFKELQSEQSSQAGRYFLVAFRHIELLDVRFVELSEPFQYLIAVLSSSQTEAAGNLKHAVNLMRERYSMGSAHPLFAQLEDFIHGMLDQGLVIGFVK